jgi:hypothetical protein
MTIFKGILCTNIVKSITYSLLIRHEIAPKCPKRKKTGILGKNICELFMKIHTKMGAL